MIAVMAKKRKPAAPANPWPERLLAIRARLKLTQEQAAERIGVSQGAWAAWESRTALRTPSRQSVTLIELLEAGKI